ncbi:19927_t:CDS:2, partial [Funneliformis geosporum]
KIEDTGTQQKTERGDERQKDEETNLRNQINDNLSPIKDNSSNSNFLPSSTDIQNHYNSDKDKSEIENNPNLITPEQKVQANELLKIVISGELLIKKKRFNREILTKLITEKKNNTFLYQLLNKESRIDKVISKLESIQQSQKKKYLWEIGIKNKTIKSAQTEIDNLEEENEELFQENESLRDELEAGLKDKQNKESRLNNLFKQRQVFQNRYNTEKEKVSNLVLELQKEQAKNDDVQHKLFETEQENRMLKYKNIELETDLNNALQKKSELRKRLIEIKRSHKSSVQKAQAANLCRDLIKYESIGELENDKDNVLKQFISQSTGSLIETVANCQQHLKLTDLTQIKTTHPMPEGKSLEDLITFYHANQTKTPTPTQPTITKLESGEPNETIIVNQIIQECDLGLNQNSSLNQVISQINKLIKTKPPTIKPVNQPSDNPFGESLEKIAEIDLNGLEKELGIKLSSEIKQQIKQATNYQELSSLRNQEIKSYLERNQGSVITSQPQQEVVKLFGKERIVWVSWLVISLLVIGGLLLKIKPLTAKKPSSKKDKLREYIEMKSKEDIFADYGKALQDKELEAEKELLENDFD